MTEPCENCGTPVAPTRGIPEIGLPVQLFETAPFGWMEGVALMVVEHTPQRCREARRQRK